MSPRSALLLLILSLGLSSCASNETQTGTSRAWGSMRTVLRDGDHSARVRVLEVSNPSTIGVGALAGLSGEIAIVEGRAWVMEGTPAGERPTVRMATPSDEATLLFTQDVLLWRASALPGCSSYDALEAAIRREIIASGGDPQRPTPVKIVGDLAHAQFHAIAGACPIADPTGPPPWRGDQRSVSAEVVGFYVESATGTWTHHGRASHLHVLIGDQMGHLDSIDLRSGTLYLPEFAEVRSTRVVE